ncbi:MAG: hypothetical protein BJBARM4_0646 [Candidatus Parvarchaeum acidiphilum ARMAN-4]|jgi:hypothetical protein|uniref:Uncharacterized protein n=1 Tax=Candidatus Parvarchaeum acidiphilum ARMAN-4 TaxID=662760 RepID=D2EFW5_PARA4|nr:MAG: hypothetical protein BJBARM4_0646 [Candidatus Parvarchaeum acidiphilum ARMAN-4]
MIYVNLVIDAMDLKRIRGVALYVIKGEEFSERYKNSKKKKIN